MIKINPEDGIPLKLIPKFLRFAKRCANPRKYTWTFFGTDHVYKGDEY